MYTREQASQARKAFWTTFGQYLRPHWGAEGLKVNWINYKTGYKGLYFRMDATKQEAFIGIVMNQRDADLRELFFQQFEELRTALHSLLEEEWTWELEAVDATGQSISRIYTRLPDVSVFNQQDWPRIISFLKPRILALDEFWSLAKHHFEPFRHF